MKKIAIIKAGSTDEILRKQYGDFEHWIIKKTGLPHPAFSILNVIEIDRWMSADAFDSIIVTGSHANVTERLEWIPKLERFVQEAHGHLIPILGICFGHQLLAKAFGGIAANNPQGPEFGSVQIKLKNDGQRNSLFHDVPNSFLAYMSHRQSVVRLPQKAVQLAVSPKDQNAAFYLEPNVWGVQFHPEFDSTIMAWYLKYHFHVQDSELNHYLPQDLSSPNIIRKFTEINAID